jgi:hypothetical protein
MAKRSLCVAISLATGLGAKEFAKLRRFGRYLAAAFLTLAAFAVTPAMAQTFTATITTSPNLGIIVPDAAGATTFRYTPAGVVSTLSGNGVRRSSSPAFTTLVTIACASTGSQCTNATAKIIIGSSGTGSPASTGLMTNFTGASLTGGASLAVFSTSANQTIFTYTHGVKTTNATIKFGADFAVNATASTTAGAATTPFFVGASRSNTTPVSQASGNASVTIYRPVSLVSTPLLRFGGIVRPPFLPGNIADSATVTMPTNSDTVAVTGTATTFGSGTTSRAFYDIRGEGGLALVITLPSPTLVLTNQSDNTKTLTVTLTNTTVPTALSGSAGAQGSASFYMGGSFPVTSNTAVGTYSGSYNVTIAYN